MRGCRAGFAAITVLLLAGTASAQRKHSAVEAVRAADQERARAFGAKDLQRSVDACVDNVSILGPGAPMVTGKLAVAQLFSAFFALPDFRINWRPTKVEVARSGELAYSVGLYESSFKDPSGKTLSDHGKYATVWKKQRNGSWKVLYDIFNSDLAAPAVSP